MKRIFMVSLLMAAATLAAVGCSGPGGRRGAPGGMDDGGARGLNAGICRSPIDQIQEQLAETARALRLTPVQAVLWDRYQSSVGALMADQTKNDLYAVTKRTALQQINGKVDVVRNRLTAMEEIGDQATALYRSLDEEQKRTADQLLGGTVPALYSGLSCQSADTGRSSEREGPSGQMGRGSRGSGGMGGGMGRF